MKIFKIKVKNYRRLKDFSIDLESGLSLVIGKNNTGKTSILSVLDKFLTATEKFRLSFDDFNIDFKKSFCALVTVAEPLSESDFRDQNGLGIKLMLFIEYGSDDNLGNINKVMMDLDPANNVVILGFEYLVSYNDYLRLRHDYSQFDTAEKKKKEKNAEYVVRSLSDFLKQNHSEYFKLSRKSIAFDQTNKIEDEKSFIDLAREKINIKDIINFKYISAKREVGNSTSDKTLSGQTSKIYERSAISDNQNAAIDVFKDKLTEADTSLSKVYEALFSSAIDKVKKFGGVKLNESEIAIISTLQHQKLLEGNTTVVYRHDSDNLLPEHYNGLGYMNLISMIFEIEILLQEFKREKDVQPADINLLFIEEPEAHTHPQMQYIFIKNIKELLKEGIQRPDGIKRDLQYIISTHSSCIVADSDFNDVKYLKSDANGVFSKNLTDLRNVYEKDTMQYQFLTQYLTISRAEIFFADKAVLIEGDTERLLIPTMMKKVDIDESAKHKAAGTSDTYLPLLSQNISIIEVGAYSHIFEKFIEFLGIKSLIITDLDSVDGAGEVCPVATGTGFSNAALSYFFGTPTLAELVGFEIKDKLFSKVVDKWVKKEYGRLCVVYQTTEDEYNARSFEEAFIQANRPFVTAHKDNFKGLKNRTLFDDGTNNSYELAGRCIKKKTHFAMDILFHSSAELDNWRIPSYINEGLLWLKQD